ncbi:MAG TPA: hypothetical protein VH498_07450 [Candidatus Dormibacteraeota bacterium]|jgi:hypothetical protein|nr:hypothetical protein [Candidatus Dormibacteraeota bacterium]
MNQRVLAPVLYALAAVAVFGGVLPVMGHSWIGLNADARQTVYWLDLVADALRHGNNPLITTAIQAPGGVNLMWNTSMVLPGVVLAPLTLVAGPYVAYDVLIIAAPVLSAWAAFAALRRFVDSPVAAWVGGLVYGFSPALLAESLGHAQTELAWFPPVVLLLLHEALVRRRWPVWRVGVVLGIAIAAQLVTGEEMVLGTALVALCGFAVLALQHADHARAAARRLGMVLATAVGVALVLAAAPLAVQFFGPYRPSGRLVPGDVVVSDAGAFLVPASRQLVRFPGLSADPWTLVTEDSGAYIGLPVMLLLVFAWDRFRHVASSIRWAAPLVVITSVLALGPHLHLGGVTTPIPLPWIVLNSVPLVENLDPARLMVVAWLSIAVVVAVTADRALRSRGRDRIVRCGLIAVALATLVPATIPVTAAAAPAYFTSPDAATIPSGDTVLIVPVADGSGLEALIWQAQAGLRWRMVDGNAYGQGHTLYFPASTVTNSLARLESGAAVDISPPAMSTMRNDLRRLGVGTVIVAGGAQHEELNLVRRLLGPETYAGGGAFVWHDVRALVAGP